MKQHYSIKALDTNPTYGFQKNDCMTAEEGQTSFLAQDVLGNTTIKAEYRVNKKERPTIRTRTER